MNQTSKLKVTMLLGLFALISFQTYLIYKQSGAIEEQSSKLSELETQTNELRIQISELHTVRNIQIAAL